MSAVLQPETIVAILPMEEVVRTEEGRQQLQRYLLEVLEGPSFRNSHRSAQFLEHVVQQSVVGQLDRLKERMIGAELFGRVPSYDTGEDAIVRVTANDVRKRLAQHYHQGGQSAEYRISLPAGKYVPELVRLATVEEIPLTPDGPNLIREETLALPASAHERTALLPMQTPWPPWFATSWSFILLGVIILAGAGWGLRSALHHGTVMAHDGPWGSFFDGGTPILVVASDPNFEEIQRITHTSVSLSDYANGRYIPTSVTQGTPDKMAFMEEILRGNKISDADGPIIAGMQSLMPPGGTHMTVKSSRGLRMQDLGNGQNLVFLGSPRSNPWSSANDQLLDFTFVFDPQRQVEIIRNARQRRGESPEYVPTAGGFETGRSYALISIFRNPGHAGRILLIAGANEEGTKAAGEAVTDPNGWALLSHNCGLHTGSAEHSFQVLFEYSTMAGAANDVKVVACHLLDGANR